MCTKKTSLLGRLTACAAACIMACSGALNVITASAADNSSGEVPQSVIESMKSDYYAILKTELENYM